MVLVQRLSRPMRKLQVERAWCRSLRPASTTAGPRRAERGPAWDAPVVKTILSWNIENLARHLGDDAPLPLESIVAGFGRPAVVCLQEVRIRPDDEALVQRMRAALPGYDCHFSLCRDRRNVTFRGGR